MRVMPYGKRGGRGSLLVELRGFRQNRYHSKIVYDHFRTDIANDILSDICIDVFSLRWTAEHPYSIY